MCRGRGNRRREPACGDRGREGSGTRFCRGAQGREQTSLPRFEGGKGRREPALCRRIAESEKKRREPVPARSRGRFGIRAENDGPERGCSEAGAPAPAV